MKTVYIFFIVSIGLIAIMGCEGEWSPEDDSTSIGGKGKDKSITQNGITFYEYLGDVAKRWGFDGKANAMAIPIDYSCGFIVNRDVNDNYKEVTIKAEPEGYISYVNPSILNKNDNLIETKGLIEGNCKFNIYAGSSYLEGRDDYWGLSIHYMDAYIYPVIKHDPLHYYQMFGVLDNPIYNPDENALKNKMNMIVQQGVVSIVQVSKHYDLLHFDVIPDKCFNYIYSTSGYNPEVDWMFNPVNVAAGGIVHLKEIILGWKPTGLEISGSEQIELETVEGIKKNNFYMFGWPGTSNWEEIRVTDDPNPLFNYIMVTPLKYDHPSSDVLLQKVSDQQGVTLHGNGYSISIVKDMPEEDFIRAASHEFMHHLKNGHITDLTDNNDDENLMYGTHYKTRIKLRYKTLGDGTLQWDDVHNGF